MEWFEIQRLLGVDHIQIMDADNPEPVQKVFRYYKDMGLLNPLPYELPGDEVTMMIFLSLWYLPNGLVRDNSMSVTSPWSLVRYLSLCCSRNVLARDNNMSITTH